MGATESVSNHPTAVNRNNHTSVEPAEDKFQHINKKSPKVKHIKAGLFGIGARSNGKRKLDAGEDSPGSPDGSGVDSGSERVSSHMEYRRQQMHDLEQRRPQLTERQMTLIVSTWETLQRDLGGVGSDMFLRSVRSQIVHISDN